MKKKNLQIIFLSTHTTQEEEIEIKMNLFVKILRWCDLFAHILPNIPMMSWRPIASSCVYNGTNKLRLLASAKYSNDLCFQSKIINELYYDDTIKIYLPKKNGRVVLTVEILERCPQSVYLSGLMLSVWSLCGAVQAL